MNRSLVGRLVAKDLYLYRWMIAAALVAGALSLVLSHFSEGDGVTTGLNVGILLFVTTIITFGIFVAMTGILKERQEGSLLFVLSLPVSPAQHALAKVGAALIAFLGPWLVFTVGVVAATAASPGPNGGIPFFVATMTFFLCNFCLLLAIVAIKASEPVAIGGILVTNLAVTVFLTRVSSLPGVAGRSLDAKATWSPAILTILGIEVAVILLSIGLALYVPSRKKDFV